MEVGFTELYNGLVERFVPRIGYQAQLTSIKPDQSELKRRLKSTIYDVLLFKIRSQAARGDSGCGLSMGVVNKLLGHVFTLRCHRRFDDASRLENLLQDINEDDETVRAVLVLILALADTGGASQRSPRESLTPRPFHISTVKNSTVLLPAGPLSYKDSRILLTDTPHYTMYPSDVFRSNLPPVVTSPDQNYVNVFKAPPGHGLSKFFSNQDVTMDTERSGTLFGALVQCRARPVEPWTKLELPAIDDQCGELTIRVPRVSPPMTDEGVHTGNVSPVSMPADDVITDDVNWLDVATLPQRRRHCAWEYRGMLEAPRVKPYLTECDLEAVNQLYWYQQDLLSTVDPRYTPVRQVYVTSQQLVKDLFYLLMGIQSRLFVYDQGGSRFRVRTGVCISGTTPEATLNALTPFLDAGALYRRLREFSWPPLLNSFYTSGLVLQAFLTAVRDYLREYEATVIAMPRDRTVMWLADQCRPVFKQLRFLAELCQLTDDNDGKPPGTELVFPTGLKLLSYIYDHALCSSATDNYRLLLTILRTTAVPYINFIQKWVFHGVCHDPYEEFMIRANSDYLFCRDKYYWSRGYELVNQDADQSMPLFLYEIMADIYKCGKAINLLKLCSPNHFMCTLTEVDVPRLMVTYSADELRQINVTTRTYVSRVEQIARQSLLSRKELLERAERTRFDLIQKGRQAAQKRAERDRQEILKLRKLRDEKKRQQLSQLRANMEQEVQRKKEEVEAQKADDKAFMESLNAKSELEERLEQQAREELIRQYERMSMEALSRERHALWRAERARLRLARGEFLRADHALWAERYQAAMTANVTAMTSNFDVNDGRLTSDDVNSDDVVKGNDVVPVANLLDITVNEPASADGRSDGRESGRSLLDVTVPVGGVGTLLDMSIQNLPKWAQSSETVVVRETGLPNWAEKRMENSETVEIESSEVDGGNIMENSDAKQNLVESPVTDLGDESKEFNVGVIGASRAPIRTAIEPSSETKPKSSIRSVSGQYATKSSVSFRDTAPELYEITVPAHSPAHDLGPSLRPVIDILNDDVSDTSFEICRRRTPSRNTSLCSPAKPEPETTIADDAKPETETTTADGIRHLKYEQTNLHGKHPSQMSSTETKLIPSRKRGPEPEISKPEVDARNLKFQWTNEHGKHPSQMSVTETKLFPSLKRALHAEMAKPDVDVRNLKFQSTNEHGKHPSQMSAPVAPSVSSRGNSNRITQQSEDSSSDSERVRMVRFKERNVHGHPSQTSRAIDEPTTVPHDPTRGTGSVPRDPTAGPQDAGDENAVCMTEHQREFKPDNHQKITKSDHQHRHPSDQSELVNVEGLKVKKFLQRNTKGHSSQSSVQKLLYGDNYGNWKKDGATERPETPPSWSRDGDVTEEFVWLDVGVQPYTDNYQHEISEFPWSDMARRVYRTSGTYRDVDDEDVSAQEHVSLPVLIKRSVIAPILAQISLTNRSLVTYFLQDQMVDRHFTALKMFMFLEDGEFGQILGDILSEKLTNDPLPHEVFNAVSLSGALMKALRSSNLAKEMSDRLLLTNKYLPKAADINGPRALDCLELHYHVTWPLNIVITDSALLRYNMIFCFLLQLKRVAWCLNDVWYRLKRDALIHHGADLSQFRLLQLYRHEMQNFVRVLQSYLANQIIHVTWQEFQQDLMEKVDNLDDLHDIHAAYINKAVFRCLLSKKAGSMMKVIQDILTLILRFHTQLLSAGWQRCGSTVSHPANHSMTQTYKTFRDYTMFLYKVIRKVTARGYQPDLEELLLRLNYNAYYTRGQHVVAT